MVKGKGRARVRAHPTQDPEYTLRVRGSQRKQHRNRSQSIDRPLTWLSFDARGIEVTVYLTPDQLRKHIAEVQAALVEAEADPIPCDNEHCYYCNDSPTAERRDS